jgi:RNA polymerase sigma-70 factor (ECF subfamily)
VNEHDATELIAGLYDRWYIKLVHYAVRTTENYPMAEDLSQDAFLQLYQALRAGKEIEHPKAWTLCVLRRTMVRRMKERTRYEALEEFEADGKRPPERSYQADLVDIAALLSVLSPREEEVLLLRLEAMKYREIADQLGISVNSVNTLLARALRKLQDEASHSKVRYRSCGQRGR